MKKNAKGVRGIKLGRTESLEAIHLLDGTDNRIDNIRDGRRKRSRKDAFEGVGLL